MIIYRMMRAGKVAAQVVTLDTGKCIVSWPTSVVVYDSEDAARAVHISHMGGRGEPTQFVPQWSTIESFVHGMNNAALDVMEGCWYASITDDYKSNDPIAISGATNPDGYIAGYAAHMMCLMPDWRADLAKAVEEQQQARRRKL